MIISPKQGVDSILFGMKQKDVIEMIGMPNKKFEDEEGNIVTIYNHSRLVLTFYEEENFKLGYITCANQEAILYDKKIIGTLAGDLKNTIPKIKKWELEDFDTFEHYFEEDNWLILVAEFDMITKIEIGATIKNDEFVWAFS